MTLIVLDAGHGPETPGKRSPDGKLREFHFNSTVALLAGERLSREGVAVRYVHHAQRDVPLAERTAAANRMNADAYISIHANAHMPGWSDAHGIETYIFPAAGKRTILLAEAVQQSLISACRRADRGVKRANFAVLRDTKMPAILAECGFMTHRTEAELLQNRAYQQQCARALAFGIVNWLYQT